MTIVCNRDCFNCIYEDCIDNDIDSDEIRQAAERDRMFARRTPKQLKDRECYLRTREKRIASSKRYRDANKEALAERQRIYRREHRDLVNERQRAYYRKTREKALAARGTPEAKAKAKACNQAYREANKEKIRQYQQEYRKRKKEEAQRADQRQDSGTL